MTDFFKKPIKKGRPKGSNSKKKRGRQSREDSEDAEDCRAVKAPAQAPAPLLRAPEIDTRGKTKTDWSTDENRQLLSTAVNDWDNHTGQWEPGDSYESFGVKYGIPKASPAATYHSKLRLCAVCVVAGDNKELLPP